MMGFCRLLFALAIMAAHCVRASYLAPWAGVAVMGFYVLAGYTSVATTPKYNGPWQFILSRVIRICPSYLAVFCLTLVGLWLGLIPFLGLPGLGIPASWATLGQLFMVVRPERIAVIPQGWMLGPIVAGYVAVALGAFATPQRTAGILVGALLIARAQSFYAYSLGLAALGISVGAAAHHLGLQIPRDRRWGAMAGALSYPVFLTHYAIAAAIPLPYGWPLFFASLPPTLAASWLLWRYVEVPCDRYRKSLRATP